ncbi:CDP-alcohol phosphatidyltransferase family protein [Methanosarcinales archaeon]|nr:MAG: CDP-alcohol phosphatidyltransferase family protein [Methanosarcinales archaeon]
MTLDEVIRARTGDIIARSASFIVRFGIRANTLTTISLIFAFLSGLSLYAEMLGVGLVFLVLSGLFDALDGAIARHMQCESKKGDFLDHVVDRYADIFILCGIILGGHTPPWIGVVAITGVLLTSYMGTQAQAVMFERLYKGIMGRSDRLVVIIIGILLNGIYPHPVMGMYILGWTIGIIGIASHITAIQRFYIVWKTLED